MGGFVESHLFLDEEEYYKFVTKPPKPMDGAYLLQKVAGLDIIKVTRPDGSSRSFNMMTRNSRDELIKLGICRDKLDHAISHVYNFRYLFVRVDFADNWGSPPSVN